MSTREELPLGEPLPGTPVLSHVEVDDQREAGHTPILNSFRTTFGNKLLTTPRDTSVGNVGDWQNEWFPPDGTAYLQMTIQWIDMGKDCSAPKFEWRQQREHTHMYPISPRAERLQYEEIKGTGHIGIQGKARRTCIHVREGIGNRVSAWSNAIWFDIDAEGKLVAQGVTETECIPAIPDETLRDNQTLISRCEALGFTREEARNLAELIAGNNNPTEDDPVGQRAWNWLKEQMGKGHTALTNITKTMQTLNGLVEAARRFWGLFSGTNGQ